MKAKLLWLSLLLLLSGCQSWYYAGLTKIKWEPIKIDGEMVCCKGYYVSGKELTAPMIRFEKTPNGMMVMLGATEARNVETLKAVGNTQEAVAGSIAEGAVKGLKGAP